LLGIRKFKNNGLVVPGASPKEKRPNEIPCVAHSRGRKEEDVRTLVQKHAKGRDLRFLGEPRVDVPELNPELDSLYAA
jgi:K+-transporting ATPase c subunit